jgi:hypothetical protein
MALPPAGAFMAFWAEMPNETAKRAAPNNTSLFIYNLQFIISIN